MLWILLVFACGLVDVSALAGPPPLDGVDTTACDLRDAATHALAPSPVCELLDAAQPTTAVHGPRVGLSFSCLTLRGRVGPTTELDAALSGMHHTSDLAVLWGGRVARVPSRTGDEAVLRHQLATCLTHGCATLEGGARVAASLDSRGQAGQVLYAERAGLGYYVVVEPGPGRCAAVSVFPDLPLERS